MQVRSLGQEDPLEEGVATHASILAWRIPWTEASPVAQQAKNLPAEQETQETRVRSLGQEDPLEQEMAPHSGMLAWKIPWTEEPGGLQWMESQRVDITVHTTQSTKAFPAVSSSLHPFHPLRSRRVSFRQEEAGGAAR